MGDQFAVVRQLQLPHRGRAVPDRVGARGYRAGAQALVHPAVHLGYQPVPKRFGQEAGKDQESGLGELIPVRGIESLTPLKKQRH
ncbi:hypothetical protein GCM10009760_56290 [Kitasatospora kazusensis]|uniref:Uncharacterized protein n=1 Tax=Kitasatospora kazusensis TaxID=407974 RepID=A0ABP5LXF9_9ACTN